MKNKKYLKIFAFIFLLLLVASLILFINKINEDVGRPGGPGGSIGHQGI